MEPSEQSELQSLRDEIALLKEELRQSGHAFNAAQYLRDLVTRNAHEDARRRRKDGFKLPSGVYETLEDIGRIEGAIDSLKRCWHADDVRESIMRLSRFTWELRKRLQDQL